MREKKAWVKRLDVYGNCIQRKLIPVADKAYYLSQGYLAGSGSVHTKRTREKIKYVVAYQPLDMTLSMINAKTYDELNQTDKLAYKKIEKKIPAMSDAELWIFLAKPENAIYTAGRNRHYNVGQSNPNANTNAKTRPQRPAKSKRMYDPNTQEKGKYIQIDEVQSYLSQGWIIGLRLNKKTIKCKKCNTEVTDGRLKSHMKTDVCKHKQYRIRLDAEFNDAVLNGLATKNLNGYTHTDYYLTHQNRKSEITIYNGWRVVVEKETHD